MDERWIARMNIAHFERRLQGALSADDRRAIEKLLVDEKAKLAALERGRADDAADDTKASRAKSPTGRVKLGSRLTR